MTGIKQQYAAYKNQIDHAIQDVLHEGCFILGAQVRELEQKLTDYVGVKHCIAVSNGTDSLKIALMALGISIGDEVITVPFTWISTVEAIALVGAKPVFVDIDPVSYLIDIEQIKAAITPKTKAIIPVSLFGQVPDFNALENIAKKHGLYIIEDGAQSFGATQKGRRSCSFSTIGSTSFFPTKPLGCYGDGGALFTNDDLLADKMRAIRNHGSFERDHHLYIGTTGRLDTIQAAILIVKMIYFEEETRIKNLIAKRYDEQLKEYCQIPKIMEDNTHVYAQYTIRSAKRDKLLESLLGKGVPARIYYPTCIHEQPAFAYLNYQKGLFPEAEKASQEVCSLPLHPWLTPEEQDLVIETVLNELRCIG